MDLKGIGSAMAGLFIGAVLLALPVGWLLIEGLVWVFTHVHIGLTP